MKKRTFILIFLIILLPLISSADIHGNYQIFSNKVFVEISYNNTQNFTYELPPDYKTLEINTKEYSITNNLLKTDLKSASFSYITEYYLDKSASKNYIIINNPFTQKADISIYLDEKNVLPESNSILVPKPNEITSDGRRIILKWNDFRNDEIVFNYEKTINLSATTKLIIIILSFIFLIIIIRYLFLTIAKNKNKKTINLYEDEKKIVEYLINKKDKESWTKEMVRELNISKVKLSRKLRSLEQKGLVKKIPYGNENKIILIN